MIFTVGALDPAEELEDPPDLPQAAAPKATAPIATTVTARLNMVELPFGWVDFCDVPR
jgi:hypothetical protein